METNGLDVHFPSLHGGEIIVRLRPAVAGNAHPRCI